jgi:hypothetical protein
MAFYATIQELIESEDDKEISYRNLHRQAEIVNNNKVIRIPYKSILRDYMPFFKSAIEELNFEELEFKKYQFKPKRLSYDLYGTTELWATLLELNNMFSIINFNKRKIKVYKPDEFKRLLNEVLILEQII